MKIKQYIPKLITICAHDIDRSIKSIDISSHARNENIRMVRMTNFTALTIWLDIIELQHPLSITPKTTVIIDLKNDPYMPFKLKEELYYKKLSEDCTSYDPEKELAIVFVELQQENPRADE